MIQLYIASFFVEKENSAQNMNSKKNMTRTTA